MATSSSCSPSSSAVTIPIPGKSILKRPPPTQSGILNRIKGFLPTQPTAPVSEDTSKPLKRAHFILPHLAIVYPISTLNPPSTPSLKDEKRAIEEKATERRKRIVTGHSIGPDDTEEWWNLDKVESFYRECSASREEEPDPAVSAGFKRASATKPRSVDLSGVQLTPTAAAILSDVFNIEWGLRKLTLRECDLDEAKLKPILHALLIPGTLEYLSVASNRRLKPPAFKLIGAYASQAKSLQFLDLSSTVLDKKSVDYIVVCLATAPEPGLVSLRLDDCSLRPNALEALARVVRTSSLRNISLRHNKITATGGGAVALALMIRDYPDIVPGSAATPASPSSVASPASSAFMSPPPSPLPSTTLLPPPTRTGPMPPPPRHPSVLGPQTTYTPYIPRSKRATATGTQPPNPLSATGQPVPIITSNSHGGVTTRHPAPAPAKTEGVSVNGAPGRYDDGPSAALLDRVRALDALPRLGALRTLDLRGNDLRAGVTYLAQVLKRNRTLKVLNLCENKLDVQCLMAIAEALVRLPFRLSRLFVLSLAGLEIQLVLGNPGSQPEPLFGSRSRRRTSHLSTCRPSTHGPLLQIQSLRTAFTLNTALKRLFLSSTQLTSAGAIALAEFLPESASLLHLDLTVNNIDLAGVMALSKGLKANHVMRCLDLNIPPDNEEFARICREILNTCVRNTEDAEKATRGGAGHASGSGQYEEGHQETPGSGKGLGKGVWGLIEESELAKSIRMGERHGKMDLLSRAEALLGQIQAEIEGTGDAASRTNAGVNVPSACMRVRVGTGQELIQKAHEMVEVLTAQIQSSTTAADEFKLERLLVLCDQLNGGIDRLTACIARQSRFQGLGLQVDGLSGTGASSGSGSASASADGETTAHGDGDEENVPLTPRVDKGKGRAEPEPEEPEKVLSPTFMITESEDEDEDNRRYLDVEEGDEVAVQATSPIDRSKSWVEEEGEIFRKGTVLLGPEEMEGEYAGEDLRRELLEAMVERAPPRGIIDEFGMDVAIPVGPYDDVPSSPALAGVAGPIPTGPRPGTSPLTSPISPSPTSPRGRAFPLLRGAT
ncbi:hypothetical protein L210DRAFT_2456252 [Boletus edulis BED1]|uniref:RNI-like protein n=1 Tax=Boletus edulis BED1 TaxID=1328754 RepID=A0AAD4GC84_BOLED|nr:hypothetical protein L210DRAFT_2456252 [Boletus edulis BED1]